MLKPVTMAAYGAGVNSTAMLVGIVEGKPAPRPGLTLFADTGGELPETYAYVELFSEWCQAHGLPPILTVRDELGGPLEQRCLDKKMLPSVAYGRNRRGCSEKSKQRPQHRYARNVWPDSMAAWARDERVNKLIGYDAGEKHRSRIEEDRWYEYHYPLMAWGWTRPDCEAAILRAGLPVPPKSACFFCPFRKKPEVLALERDHPELLARALAIEEAAAPNLRGGSIKGLGGYFSWRDWLDGLEMPLFPDMDDNPFGCLCVGPTPEDEFEGDA